MCEINGLNNTHGKIDAENTVQDDEDIGIVEVLEAVIKADREHEDHEVQVEVEGGPSRGLVLRDGRDDGNVVLGKH